VRTLVLIVAVLLLAAAGCGDDERSAGGSERPAGEAPAAETAGDADATGAAEARRRGTRIALGDSEYGEMLFGPRRQAIYVFERDRRRESRCYGECARAWPPVYTRGKPVAGRGVRASLLGTTRRRDGRRQVTYRGRPLYYYAHEGPGEVRCHNVDLNGGLWWVVGPDGRPRP
jgi:predicted lipoprotein with Yx(FWY)xxD motif